MDVFRAGVVGDEDLDGGVGLREALVSASDRKRVRLNVGTTTLTSGGGDRNHSRVHGANCTADRCRHPLPPGEERADRVVFPPPGP